MQQVPEFDPAREELVIGSTNPTHYRVIPVLNHEKPSYEHGARRVAAAARRLDEFVTEVSRRLPSALTPVRVRYTLQPGSSEPTAELDWSGATLPVSIATEFSPLASEIIHHLRTALEYLVFNMVWSDTGRRPTDWLKAPCHKTEAGWKESVKYKPLSQLSADNRLALQAVQPFTGTMWLAQLTSLSNPDKHHSPIQVVPGIQWVMPTEMVLHEWCTVGVEPRLMVKQGDNQLEFIETAQAILLGLVELLNPLMVADGLNPITVRRRA